MTDRTPLQAMPTRKRSGDRSAGPDVSPFGDGGGEHYPNPHDAKSADKAAKGFTGGQSRKRYHGSGQLGTEPTRPGGNPNVGGTKG